MGHVKGTRMQDLDYAIEVLRAGKYVFRHYATLAEAEQAFRDAQLTESYVGLYRRASRPWSRIAYANNQKG